MYYAIEGKRLLKVLYIAGALLGSLMINIGLKSSLIHSYDFLDAINYLTTFDPADTSRFFFYVLFTRIRQLLVFIISLLTLSPFAGYCLFIFLFSFLTGSFLSAMTAHFGIAGIWYGSLFLFPHTICYGIMLYVAYTYIFFTRPGPVIKGGWHKGRRSWSPHHRLSRKIGSSAFAGRQPVRTRLLAALILVIMFGLGCVSEGLLNPLILRMFLKAYS
ncbi:MAG: hypothetical protein IJ137_02030 [Eubacterium sp.]|nr:hypothetical protein [Eubacterium sp.]